MPNMLFANNCNTTLSGSLTNVATTMSVTSATGFPSPTGSQYFYCTLADAATQTTIEIVKVTAVSGTTFTIVRGQDGTSGTGFASGAIVSLRLVRANLNDFPKLDEANTFTQAQTFSALTSGRIPYSSTGGLQTDSANLTFDGTNLSVGGTITSASNILSSKTTSGQVTNLGNGKFTVIDRRTSLVAVNFLQIDLNANGGTAIISVVCAAQFSGVDNGATVKTWFVSRYGSSTVTITEKLAQNSGVANFITCTSSGNYIILAYTQPGVLTNYFDTFVDILAVGTTNGTTPANVVVTTL